MKIRMASAVAIGAMGASLVLGACGGSSKSAGGTGNNVTAGQTPQQAVETAISKLGGESNMKVAVSLPITAAQAQQLSAKSGGSKMSPAEAHALTTGSVFFSESTGHGEAIDSTQARTDPQNTFDFGLAIGGDTPLEVRYVDQNLYVLAQVKTLLTDVGDDPAKADKVSAELAQVNSFVPGISDLGQGKWVEVDHAGLESLGAAVKQADPQAAAAGSSQIQSSVLKLRTEVLSALKADSTFASLGNSGGRSGYSVTVNVASLLNTLAPQVESTLSSLPGVGNQISGKLSGAASSVPSGQTAVIDVYVSDNKLSEADLDVNQFAGKDKVNFAVPVRMAFSSPGAASAPSGATKLDVSKVPSLLGNLLGGLGGSSSSSSSSATTSG